VTKKEDEVKEEVKRVVTVVDAETGEVVKLIIDEKGKVEVG